jgi:nitrous oxide reductase accessory protein NosL
LLAPSAHGQPLQVLVEVMDPSEDPRLVHTGPHSWIPAEEGVYVLGIARTQIMGPPVLVYRDRAHAERVIAGTSARMLSFSELDDWWRSHVEE